jgi:hypothetical protein
MWFTSKRSESVEEQPQHWPTDRMINEGHSDYATHEDFDGLPDDILKDVADLCEVEEAAPDECIPCWAYAEYLERQKRRLAEMAPKDPEVVAEMEQIEEEPETPKLDALVSEADTFTEPEMKPIASQFAAKVEELSLLVQELLDGPPIPPKDVSMSDLALLVLAADRWVNMTESQGMELSGQPKAVLDSTKALVARLRS